MKTQRSHKEIMETNRVPV